MNQKNDLTTGSVAKTLLHFMIPVLLALALQSIYGIVDLLVVTHFSTVGDISGVTIGSQVNSILINTCASLAMGTTILLGVYIGGGDQDNASRTIGSSIIIFAITSVIVTLGLFFATDAIVVATQTPTEAIAATTDYIAISALGATFIIFYNLLGSIFRGIGDSRTPLLSVGIACIFNTILDLILVAVFDMGAAGAALATVIAQGLSVIICIFILRKRTLPFTFKKEYLKLEKFYSKEVLRLGSPMAIQSILTSGSFLAVTAIINGFGVYASSAVGIVQKITTVIMLISASFMHSLASFVAQNRGANQMERAKEGLFTSLRLSFVISGILAYLSWFHGDVFIGLFTSDPPLVEASIQFLRAYALETALTSVYFCMMGYFNGCGKTTFTSIQGTVASVGIRLPLTLLFAQLSTNLTIVGLGIPISTALQIIVCAYYYRRLQRTGLQEKVG